MLHEYFMLFVRFIYICTCIYINKNVLRIYLPTDIVLYVYSLCIIRTYGTYVTDLRLQ